MDILNLVLKTLYLILPAYLANMGATLSTKWKFLSLIAKPIDAGKNFGQNRLLGDGKTWRGLIVGSIIALIIVLMQTNLFNQPYFNSLSLIDYSKINFFLLGLVSGAGALLGDIIASFFKRRFNLKRGALLPLIDQWDFITSYFLLLALVTYVDWDVVIIAYLLTLVFHPLSNVVAYLLKIKKVWW